MLDHVQTVDPLTRSEGRVHPQLSVPELPEVVQLLTRRLKALDLGCGDGANALLLAEIGFATIAVDASPYQVRRLQRVARARHLPLHPVLCEPRLYPLRGTFDLIVAHHCLHPLPPDEQRALIVKLQGSTRRGGFNVVVIETPADPHADPGRDAAAPEGLDLFEMYQDWEVLVRQRYTRGHPTRHTDAEPVTSKLVVRKP